MDLHRKRRVIVGVQRYLLNPPVELVVLLGVVPGYALIETVGRRSGRRRRTVVGVHRAEDGLWIVAEHGCHAGYVRNLRATPQVRLRLRGRWHEGVARVVDDDDPRARLAGFGRPAHERVVRRFGTQLLSIHVALA